MLKAKRTAVAVSPADPLAWHTKRAHTAWSATQLTAGGPTTITRESQHRGTNCSGSPPPLFPFFEFKLKV
jgi:hypothetical protein